MLGLWNDWDGFRRGDFAEEFARALRAFDELRTGWDRVPEPRGFLDAPRFELSDQGDSLTPTLGQYCQECIQCLQSLSACVESGTV